MATLERPPLAVWLLVAAQCMLSLTYAVITPAFQGPDETQHVDMVVAAGELRPWPTVGERLLSRQVRDAQQVHQFSRMGTPRPAHEAPPRAERPTFEDLESPRPTAGTNHINQHPPLYYVVANAWTSAVTALSPVDLGPVDRTVLVMRAFGAALGGVVVLCCWWAGRVIGMSRRVAVTAAAVPLAIPMFVYLHGSVSNDTLLNALMAGLTVQLLAVLRDGTSTRRAVIGGLLAGGAMITKLFGLMALPMIGMSLLWLPSGNRRANTRFAVITLGTAFLTGGWWWIRNLLVEGTLQPEGLAYRRTPDPDPDLLTFVKGADLRLWQGFFGRFGNLNTPIPRWLLILLTVVLLGAAVFGVTRLLSRRSETRSQFRRGVLLAALPFAGILIAEVARVAYRYTTLGRLAGLQGRYTFLGMVGIALLVATGLYATMTRRWGLGMLLLAGAVSHPVAMFAIVRQFWGIENGPVLTSLEALYAWAPFATPWTTVAVGGSLVGLWVALGVTARSTRTPEVRTAVAERASSSATERGTPRN